ncbi:MAG: pre-peptidase C-terminal domain-containing protein [Pleurocapsa sp. MO_226.B13]|nr:pre-peptidase C-terminal domain-containing protein [Pleurocapsa sp. MO_226.B13]
MYKTKMVKVDLPRVPVCIFSLIVNLLVLGIQPLSTVAQDSESQPNNQQAANNAPTTIEPEILSEINRVRTNPQGYAQWLEEQRQYYDGIWLKLPGEKPIRTNKGLKALEEAIAILKEQQPLAPLSESELAAATAIEKLNDFATAHNIQYISYGRITPKGIVMSLVVDDLFPDRRRRNSLLSPDADNTGVICKPDPRYAKVCAIAYADSTVDVAEVKPETATAPEPETAIEQSPPPQNTETAEPQPSPNVTEPVAEEPEIATDPPQNTETAEPQPSPAVTEPAAPEPEIATEPLPQPPQAPPTPSVPEVTQPTVEDEEEMEVARADREEEVNSNEAIEPEAENEELEAPEEEVATSEIEPEAENEELEAPEGEVEVQDPEEEELDSESQASADDSENEEVFQAEEDTQEVATNSDSSRILENIERGTLEEGDRIIAEDGSFYDSYPLEGRSGESFTIYLESDQFDAFVALIDAQGNIIEQNDDIDEENSNSRIQVTIPEDGVYNVIVNAYDKGGTGEYVLTVRR